ncbi:MAG: phosphatase PAP2 family protein [Eubacterium sp.]|nr:phosphatase PAP2 family protein [Eubacterium sp.]
MERKLKISEIVPKQQILPLIFAFAFNMAVYAGARMIAGEWEHYDIEGALDRRIPLWTPSVAIYLGCYLFWAWNYICIARQAKKDMCRFFAADFLSRLVCFAVYLLFPTTNTRPAIAPDGFWNRAMLFVYKMDAPDNLFPSIHCLVSWFCYIGIRGRKEYPLWYRGASCVMAVLVCVSTLTTKQHVVIDVAGGVLLAELCYWIAKKPSVWKCYEKVLDLVNGMIFTKGSRECRVERKQ